MQRYCAEYSVTVRVSDVMFTSDETQEEIKEVAQSGVEAVSATLSASQSSSAKQPQRLLRRILEVVNREPGANLVLGVTKSTYQVVFLSDPENLNQ